MERRAEGRRMNYSPVVIVVDEEAVEIGDLYARSRNSLSDSVRCLIEAGRRLKAKKESLPHGGWLPWLAANADALGFDGPRTADRLMRAAKMDVNVQFDEKEATQISREMWGNPPQHRTAYTGNYEWHTPAEYVGPARRVLGVIDLDPASCALAQETVRAARYFSADDDGLRQEWRGRVWLNPPYSQPAIEQFIDKLIEELVAARATQAILLTHNSTDTGWFHKAANAAAAICFTRGRIAFVDTDGERAAPPQGQAFFFFGPDTRPFKAEFSQVGFVVGALR
jgi:phage N-6-adenine-methyltransferase